MLFYIRVVAFRCHLRVSDRPYSEPMRLTQRGVRSGATQLYKLRFCLQAIFLSIWSYFVKPWIIGKWIMSPFVLIEKFISVFGGVDFTFNKPASVSYLSVSEVNNNNWTQVAHLTFSLKVNQVSADAPVPSTQLVLQDTCLQTYALPVKSTRTQQIARPQMTVSKGSQALITCGGSGIAAPRARAVVKSCHRTAG